MNLRYVVPDGDLVCLSDVAVNCYFLSCASHGLGTFAELKWYASTTRSVFAVDRKRTRRIQHTLHQPCYLIPDSRSFKFLLCRVIVSLHQRVPRGYLCVHDRVSKLERPPGFTTPVCLKCIRSIPASLRPCIIRAKHRTSYLHVVK